MEEENWGWYKRKYFEATKEVEKYIKKRRIRKKWKRRNLILAWLLAPILYIYYLFKKCQKKN